MVLRCLKYYPVAARHLALVFMAGLLLLQPAGAQGNKFTLSADLRFDNYRGTNDFSWGYVTRVVRARDGYLWAGGDGVSRFDGVRYQVFSISNNNRHQLRHSGVTDLAEDRMSRIWTGSYGGVCWFDKHQERFHYIDVDSSRRIEYGHSFCMTPETLWFISNNGLTYVNLQTLKAGCDTNISAESLFSIWSLDNDTLLLSLRSGKMAYYHILQGRLEPVPPETAFHPPVTSMASSQIGTWLGSYDGLWLTAHPGAEAVRIKGTEQLNITEVLMVPELTGDSILWLGTLRAGLVLFNTNTRRIVYSYTHDKSNPHSIAANEINAISVDKNNLVWLATVAGVSLMNPGNQFMKKILTPDEYVLEVAQDSFAKDEAWVSLYRKGLMRIKWKTKEQLQHVYSLRGNKPETGQGENVYDMMQMGRDKWLLLSTDHLTIWDSKTGAAQDITEFPTNAGAGRGQYLRNIIPYNNDTCFITSYYGLYRCLLPSGKIDSVLQRNNRTGYSDFDITNGRYDEAGSLWLATRNGLMRYTISSGQKIMYRIVEPRYKGDHSRNFMADVDIDHANNKVFCATASGIAILDIATGKFRFIERLNDISYPSCAAVYKKDSLVWVSSNRGLIRINTNNPATDITIRGDASFSPLPFAFVGNDVVLCAWNMYSYFNPQLAVVSRPSKPVIEKITINGKPLFFPKERVPTPLKYDENTISFRFTAFDFNDAEHIKFRYRLEGLSDKWAYPEENREANYINLSPGNYSFVLQAGNRRGEWNETPSRLAFEITPPFWQTWWFRALMVIAFVGTVAGIAILRVRTIKKREEEQTALNKSMAEMEMQVLLNQMNPHFIFNSLNSIQKFIWENKQEDAAEYLTKFSRLIRMILDNSMQKWITLEQELDALSLYLELEHRRCNNKFDYFIQVEQNVDTSSILFPSLMLQPYVENAVWHGLVNKEGRGVLLISIGIVGDELVRCIIEDNGIGRAAAAALKEKRANKSVSYGMQITKQRLEMMFANGRQGSVQLEDLYEETGTAAGTRIILHIPFSAFIKV